MAQQLSIVVAYPTTDRLAPRERVGCAAANCGHGPPVGYMVASAVAVFPSRAVLVAASSNFTSHIDANEVIASRRREDVTGQLGFREPLHRLRRNPLILTILDCGALVVILFALGEADVKFDPAF